MKNGRAEFMMRIVTVALLMAGVAMSGLWLDRDYTPALGAAVACLATAAILLIMVRTMR